MDELNQTYTTPEGSAEEKNAVADNQMQGQPENRIENAVENQEDNYIEIPAEVIRNEIKKAK